MDGIYVGSVLDLPLAELFVHLVHRNGNVARSHLARTLFVGLRDSMGMRLVRRQCPNDAVGVKRLGHSLHGYSGALKCATTESG